MLSSSERHDEHDLDAWREQVEEALNPRGEDRSLGGGPDMAYSDFLEYMFFHYGENVREAERATAEG
jgi:hypothetical protein